jgi:hypothetical protein
MIYPTNYQVRAGTVQLFEAGAAPKYLYGDTVITSVVRPHTLSAQVLASAKTSTLTITGFWQVSDDNSTWIKAVPQNNAAGVAQVTGTGSAVASTVAYDAPDCVVSYKYARFAVVSGTGAADGTDDKATISYRFLKD